MPGERVVLFGGALYLQTRHRFESGRGPQYQFDISGFIFIKGQAIKMLRT